MQLRKIMRGGRCVLALSRGFIAQRFAVTFAIARDRAVVPTSQSTLQYLRLWLSTGNLLLSETE